MLQFVKGLCPLHLQVLRLEATQHEHDFCLGIMNGSSDHLVPHDSLRMFAADRILFSPNSALTILRTCKQLRAFSFTLEDQNAFRTFAVRAKSSRTHSAGAHALG